MPPLIDALAGHQQAPVAPAEPGHARHLRSAGQVIVQGRQFSDDGAWHALSALPGPYLPWGSGAMRPAGLVAVCNDIVLGRRNRIVELGSGLSTILLARLLHLREPGQRESNRATATNCAPSLVAVEHDDAWTRWVRAQLELEGLSHLATVVRAPLTAEPHAGSGLPWYDEDTLLSALDAPFDNGVDLLLVDGPPAHAPRSGAARYPALPTLASRLAPGASVILDDVERPGEQDVLSRWETETGLVFVPDRQAGIARATTPLVQTHG